MVKRALTLLTSILIALPLLMPFNIYADSLPQSEIVGVSWNLIDTEISLSSGGNWYTYTYELEVKLKNKYVGVVNGTLSYSYSDVQSSSSSPTQKTSTTTKTNYVNGDSFKFNVYISNIGSQFTGNGPMYNCSYLINNASTNVTKYEDLNSIESVVNVLNDIYQNSNDIEGLSTNQLAELEKIVQNTSLANDYLDSISKLRQWNIPFESLNIYLSMMYRNIPIVDFIQYNSLNYPVFKISNGNEINRISLSSNQEMYFIFFIENINIYDISTFNQYFSVTGGEVVEWYRYSLSFTNNWSPIVRIKIKKNSSGYNLIVNYIGNNQVKFIPFYFNRIDYKYISTEFALQFGLSNQLLDDLHIIANGTVQSNSAASSNDLANEQLQTDSNTLFDQENGFKSDMQNAMQNVNNTFRLQDMGTKFVSSAQWVRTQYESLTNNTPFASLITFSLITGLALILLGKVYK